MCTLLQIFHGGTDPHLPPLRTPIFHTIMPQMYDLVRRKSNDVPKLQGAGATPGLDGQDVYEQGMARARELKARLAQRRLRAAEGEACGAHSAGGSWELVRAYNDGVRAFGESRGARGADCTRPAQSCDWPRGSPVHDAAAASKLATQARHNAMPSPGARLA